MKGYVFTYGVDGFGADTAPAFEEGCYLNFEKAFAHLVELNHQIWAERHAEAEEDYWEEFMLNEENFNLHQINNEPYFGMYALEEIEIIED